MKTTNRSRAHRADVALAAYINHTADTPDEAHLSDLLCDLQHLARRDGRSFAVELARATANFLDETSENDAGAFTPSQDTTQPQNAQPAPASALRSALQPANPLE